MTNWHFLDVGRYEYAASLPRSVSKALAVYFELLRSEDARFIRGVYLLGSVALGDYQDGRSDIDFGAVVDEPVDDRIIDCLSRVHHAMSHFGGPSFDGFYVEAHRVHCVPTSEELATFSLDGSFHRNAPCFECNPVTWLLWSTSGIALFGPSPKDLRIASDHKILRRFQIANLEGYWRIWMENISTQLSRKAKRASVDADTIAWGVLGVARIACTLATGRVMSKTDAGLWAQTQYGREDRVIVDQALAARSGNAHKISIEQGMAALKFMEKVRSSAISAPA